MRLDMKNLQAGACVGPIWIRVVDQQSMGLIGNGFDWLVINLLHDNRIQICD